MIRKSLAGMVTGLLATLSCSSERPDFKFDHAPTDGVEDSGIIEGGVGETDVQDDDTDVDTSADDEETNGGKQDASSDETANDATEQTATDNETTDDDASPEEPGAVCGDGKIDGEEDCDDGGNTANDGCSAVCTVEAGWLCDGEPSSCAGDCGDGQVRGTESCDDGGTSADDGCTAACSGEPGWACSGEPSSCAATCGDGTLDEAEGCDDGGTSDGDGCDGSCQVEDGYACQGTPSECNASCGNGDIDGGEECDDGNFLSNDGCSSSCAVEAGWDCSESPSSCGTVCGDGKLAGDEQCDDSNTSSSDGCSDSCTVEPAWTCAGEPSACELDCGNGELDDAEECDDGNTMADDGCGQCAIQDGWECSGEPSDCSELLPPTISAFSASEDSLPGGGGEVLLAWTVSDAEQLRVNADGMNDLGVVTGSFLEVAVTSDVTFTLIAENEAGRVERSLSVEINSVGESDWSSQFGTAESDAAREVAVAKDGSIYVVGDTTGDMNGNNAGDRDIFITKFTAAGSREWTEQLGSTQIDQGSSVDVDNSGNVYIGGSTYGALEVGSSNAGTSNCVFAKYLSTRDFEWAHQLPGGQCYVAVGGSSLYVAYTSGSTSYLRKYSLGGEYENTQCSHDFSNTSDSVTSVVADNTSAYFVGNSFDDRGGTPVTAFACSSSGSKLWDIEWNPGSYPYTGGAALADGTLYISGSVSGGLDLFGDSAGTTDAFAALLSTSEGDLIGGVQLGSTGYDGGNDVAVDSRGNVIVAGDADGSFETGKSGAYFVAKRSPSNESMWLSQFGPLGREGNLNGVAVSPNGMVVAVGVTSGELSPNPPGGETDAFIVTYK